MQASNLTATVRLHNVGPPLALVPTLCLQLSSQLSCLLGKHKGAGAEGVVLGHVLGHDGNTAGQRPLAAQVQHACKVVELLQQAATLGDKEDPKTWQQGAVQQQTQSSLLAKQATPKCHGWCCQRKHTWAST